MTPAQLSRQLREDRSPHMRRRRWMVGLSLVGVTMGQIVAAFQTGLIKRLPDPPIGPFDSERVDASDYAYSRGQTPDALFMIITYGVTAALAGAGGRDRAQTHPALPLALTAKAAFDAATCVRLGVEEWRENKALCAYCQLATAASFATLALSMWEARDAARVLERRAPKAGRRVARTADRALSRLPGRKGGRSLEDLARRAY